MTRENVKYELTNILGSFSTVRDELADVIKEAVDMVDTNGYEIYDGGEYFGVAFESEEGEEELIVAVEQAGSTWYLADVR